MSEKLLSQAPRDLIVGIHWFNTERRIDLDLSVIDQSGKIGWDAAYRTDDRSVLFSGDVTDAPRPHGASELFYFKRQTHEPKILSVNYFNFDRSDPVDCKLLAAHESPGKKFAANYMVDVSKIVAQANVKISRRQSLLGLIVTVDGENRIYFANVSTGNSITARANKGDFQRLPTRMARSLCGGLTSGSDRRDSRTD